MNRKTGLLCCGLMALALVAVFSLSCSPVRSVGDRPSLTTKQDGEYTSISSDELTQMLKSKDFYLANVHIPYAGEIAGTDAKIPYNEIKENIGKFPLDKGARIVVYCMSGNMSKTAALTLISLGYSNVFDLAGGMAAWEKAGYKLQGN